MAVLRYFHQPPKATTSTVVVNNTAILTVSAALNNKVDKSAGRGLSQNNYSTPEKNKLKGVEDGAEVNVLADWNELNIESDAYIQNKPESLPASDVYEWAKQPTKPSYTPTEIGLGNVTNDAQVKRSEMGVANGVATLNQDGLVPSTQLPSYVDDVLEYSSASLFPRPGTDGKIYVDTTTNLTYRWSGSDYVEISKSLALGETSSTAYRGDRGATAYTHATDSSRLTTATSVGLYKVGCTAQGHISGLTAITKADITGLGIPAQDTNTTYSFAGGTNKFTVTPSGGTAQDVTVTPSISAATQSAAGLMSAADKKKLDGIAAGAQVNSVTGVKGNSESSYRTGNVNITATNIGLSNVANLDLSKAIKSITRSDTTFTYTCLDGTTGTFTLLDNNTTYSAGTGLSLSNTTFSLALTKKLVTDALGYTPPTTDTNTTYSAGSGLSLSGTTFSLALTKALVTTALGYTPPTSDTNTWRTVLCNGTSIGNNTLNLKAGTNVTLSNSDGTITISSTDTNTWPSKVSQLTNDSGYITGITKTMVTTALGYTPPTTDTNTWRTVQCNGTSIGNNTLNIKAGTNVSLSNSNGAITITSTDTNTWRPLGTGASDACAGNDSRLSNARPASDVYSWAKASTKPSYAWSEITGKPSTFTPSSHNHDDLYTRGTSSPRDFTLGTLVRTDIDYSKANGAAFLGLIRADTYNKQQCWTSFSGYIYNSTIINYGLTNMSSFRITSLIAQNVGGKLCFWMPRWAYWQSFGFTVYASNSNYIVNHVTSIENASDPNGSKRVQLCDNLVNMARTSEIPSTISWSNVSSKPETATRWPSWSEVTSKPSTFTPSSHTHSYLPLSGGTCTGEVAVKDKVDAKYVKFYNTNYTDFAGYVGAGSTSANYIFVEAYGNNSIIFRTNSALRCQIDGAGKWWFPNHTSLYGGGELNIRGSEAGGTIYLSYCCSMNGSSYWYIPIDGKAKFVSVSLGSDIRKKDIVSDTDISITTIALAPLFKFLWKDKNIDDSVHIGTSAQYWKENTPELVTEEDNEDKTLSIEYSTLGVAASISIAKEVVKMQNKIDTLEQRILQLEEQLSKLIK